MDGTIFSVGIEPGITGIIKVAFVCVSFATIAILASLWRREVNERKRQSKKLLKESEELLEKIKSYFGGEIVVMMGWLGDVMESVLTDFKRGEYSVIFKDIIQKLLTRGFSENIFLLCSGVDKLSMEIKDGVGIKNISDRDRVEISSLISSILTSIKSMETLINNYGKYGVESFHDVIVQCSKRDEIVKGLQNNVKDLQQCVSGLDKSKEE